MDTALDLRVAASCGSHLQRWYLFVQSLQIIDRFSEDIDLTYDIRKLIPDLIDDSGELPSSRSQASKWTQAVRHRLPDWIETNAQPVIQAALEHDRLDAQVEIGGQENDKLLLRYRPLAEGTGYVAPVVTLEFGARATGEPHQIMPVTCDMDGYVPEVSFPTASPLVMSLARTFWEKATAAHVYCAQGRIRGERYARHWHDLAAIARSAYFHEVVSNRAVATMVAQHKSIFFIEKDTNGAVIDYTKAAQGQLRLVPEEDACKALADDYAAMLDDAILLGNPAPFDQLMQACAGIEGTINGADE